MRRAVLSLLISAVLAGGVAAGQPSNTVAPVLDVALRAAPGAFAAGDEVPVAFTITNVGSAPYVYSARTYDRSGRLPEFELDAFDERGARAVDPRATGFGPGGYIGGGLARSETLAPGQSFTQTIALNLWARLDTGRYTVRGLYRAEYRGATFESPPISIDIVQPDDVARAARIEALRISWSNATDRSEKQDVMQRVAFAADDRALPVLLDALHDRDGSFWAAEALIHYLALTPSIRDRVVADMRDRGMPPNGLGVLKGIGAGDDVIVSVIEASLDPARRDGWEGSALAAQQYPGDRLMPRLIAIAMTDQAPGRVQAIFAIAFNRTDEGVAALRTLMSSDAVDLRRSVTDAIRAAYRNRSAPRGGRPLFDSDFPEFAR